MKTLYICEKPSAGKALAKNLVSLGCSGQFADHSFYRESDTIIVAWANCHLFRIPKMPGVTDDKNRMEFLLNQADWADDLCPDWPFELIKEDDFNPAESQYFRFNLAEERFNAINTLIHRQDVNNIVHACDAGPDGEIIGRIILHMAKTDKPISRLALNTTTVEELRSRRILPIRFYEKQAAEGFENMYFNFRRGNVQLHLGDTPLNQAPTCKEEALANDLRKLTTGKCCDLCGHRSECLDAGLTACPAFFPSTDFVSKLRDFF